MGLIEKMMLEPRLEVGRKEGTLPRGSLERAWQRACAGG